MAHSFLQDSIPPYIVEQIKAVILPPTFFQKHTGGAFGKGVFLEAVL